MKPAHIPTAAARLAVGAGSTTAAKEDGARRGPQEAENRPKTRGRIHDFYRPESLPIRLPKDIVILTRRPPARPQLFALWFNISTTAA